MLEGHSKCRVHPKHMFTMRLMARMLRDTASDVGSKTKSKDLTDKYMIQQQQQ